MTSDNVIVASILLMVLMIGLALNLLGMVFKATTKVRLGEHRQNPTPMVGIRGLLAEA